MGNLGTTWSDARRQKQIDRFGTPQDRFFRAVEYDTNGGCWLWGGTIIKETGYGQIQIDGIADSAHRLSYRLFRQEPGELLVCHTCDIRCCVNPAHLFLGTCQDNINDMVAKGRSACGERNAHSKLTAADIPEIRRLRAEGLSQAAIGERVGVSQVKISQILGGKAWAHVQ